VPEYYANTTGIPETQSANLLTGKKSFKLQILRDTARDEEPHLKLKSLCVLIRGTIIREQAIPVIKFKGNFCCAHFTSNTIGWGAREDADLAKS
jgi:hypothetical protein